jgi:phage N-6-adenine-methyltransferase
MGAGTKSTLWGSGGIGYSSKTELWATPQDFFTQLDDEFHFDLDVCASPTNAKCSRYFTSADDGLAQDWQGRCWMNPPYGRTIGEWMNKAHASALSGATVVCLVPARTDTSWWHKYAMRASEIRLVCGRLKFGDCSAPAPFPNAVVVFRPPSEDESKGPAFSSLSR